MKWKFSLIVFIASLLLFSTGINRSSIYILDESKNAQCAWEMYHSDNMTVPTFNGKLRTDKPPLHYYLIMTGFRIWGKNAFAARIFSSLSGAILMALICIFIYTNAGFSLAFWTITILLSSVLWVFEFHLAVPDPFLILFVVTGLMCFFQFSQNLSKLMVIGMYISLSFGFLAKGPVAIVLPAIIILIYLFINKTLKWAFIKKMLLIPGILIFLTINLPWYLLVHQATDGEWSKGFFLIHNFERFSMPKSGHGGNIFTTGLFFVAGLMPFILFFPGIIKKFIENRQNKLLMFSLIVVLVFVVFFTFSRTKLPNYIMPCFPFAAIIFGNYMSDRKFGKPTRRNGILLILIILFIITAAIPIIFPYLAGFEPALGHISEHGKLLFFLPFLVGTSIYLLLGGYFRSSFIVVAGAFSALSFILFYIIVPQIDRYNPVNINLEILQKSQSVKYYRSLNPSFVFNYGQIGELNDTIEIRNHLQNPLNVLITSKEAMKDFPLFWSQYELIYQEKDLFDSNYTTIICKKD